ncbi:MAG: tripartite tricarboxylate transporter TctB family protein [Candidatus Heteroscillospira sp.]|jgi:hypothetical protein
MKDYIAAVGSIIFSAYVYFVSQDFAVAGGGLAGNPAYYPRALAIIIAVLGTCIMVNAIIQKKKLAVSINKELLINVGQVFAALLAYVICFEFVGFIASTAVFIIGCVLMYGGKIKSALLCSIPFTAAMYIVFHIIMQVAMPQGILF